MDKEGKGCEGKERQSKIEGKKDRRKGREGKEEKNIINKRIREEEERIKDGR